MTFLRIPLVLACVAVMASAVAMVLRPSSEQTKNAAPRYVLEEVVPRQFADWQELPVNTAQVVNPQAGQLLNKLYSQILNRNYVNSKGERIMLSLAYGGEQRGDLRAHMPEVCYPAQGFMLHGNMEQPVETAFGSIAARRLSTSLGPRIEPVTYWFTVGDTAVKNKFEQRMVEIRLGLTGQIPDGLLFRVSSLDGDAGQAYRIHDAFVSDLLGAVSPESRRRLSGLGDGHP